MCTSQREKDHQPYSLPCSLLPSTRNEREVVLLALGDYLEAPHIESTTRRPLEGAQLFRNVFHSSVFAMRLFCQTSSPEPF